MSFRIIASIASTLLVLLVSAALAQQFGQAVSTACNANNRGTVNCPTYTAPATTVVPRAPMDGSMTIPALTLTTLFNGAVPPNGFMVDSVDSSCSVNDNGPAGLAPGRAGFYFDFRAFITPPGYKPIGAVSVICGSPTYVAARGW
jgi:hypothetical protein